MARRDRRLLEGGGALLRVIAGSAKGRGLRAPRAAKQGPSRIRPTSDKVRGALFDMLAPEIDGSIVLDLYAGTGALAIEALSRGAARADLVECDREALRLIEANLVATNLKRQADVWPLRVDRALKALPGRKTAAGDGPARGYDLILADPPYADPTIVELLGQIGSGDLLRERGLLAIEHASRLPLPDRVNDLHLLKRRRHGDTTISIYRYLPGQDWPEQDWPGSAASV
ncbi:MAG: 16S rRNA (guanine(966)-N(2))-methyltransferase RsmD [Chloroflexota bacterium]